MDASDEGYVAVFADGQRFKFKSREYMRLHKIVTGLSYKNTLEAVASGAVDSIREIVPDEFLGEFERWVAEIGSVAEDIENRVEHAFSAAPKSDRKEFALWVNKHHPELSAYLFYRMDGKPIRPLIYKRGFADRV